MEELWQEFVRVMVPGLTHWNHPGFMAYFPSSGSVPGVLAEYLIAALNQQAMLWQTSPTATEVENVCLKWLQTMLGLPPAFTGVTFDGGSMSNLHALLAARHAAISSVRARGFPRGIDNGGYRIYCSEHAHSSVDKAAIVLGLGTDAVRRVSTDPQYRMDPMALVSQIRRDRAAGCVPIAVVATAGATGCGAVDPIAAIAAVCSMEQIWLHVDASWAGAAAILPEQAACFRGWAQADSLVVNPHKWMFTPLDMSVCYFQRLPALTEALAVTPDYLRHPDAHADLNLMDRGIALGRRFRGLKLWFVLNHLGVEGMQARIREHIRLAREFADAVEGHPELELAAPVSFSLVCFRAVPKGVATQHLDAFNEALLTHVNARGAVLLSGTRLGGRFVLRLVVGHARTQQAQVDEALRQIEQALRACSNDVVRSKQ
jgi:aromatic-L-amino-acid decarboxylase